MARLVGTTQRILEKCRRLFPAVPFGSMPPYFPRRAVRRNAASLFLASRSETPPHHSLAASQGPLHEAPFNKDSRSEPKAEGPALLSLSDREPIRAAVDPSLCVVLSERAFKKLSGSVGCGARRLPALSR